MLDLDKSMDALVIGAGPAGLMAAEALARAGRWVVVAEAKTSPARKFLMAGKSGLNLTKVEAQFGAAYAESEDWLAPMLAEFGPEQVQDWALGLGQEVFAGSTGRVFPAVMKASPLLRAWLARLDELGVVLRRNWRWTGWDGSSVCFETPEGAVAARPKVTVLACGGASWTRLGSDGAWADWLGKVTPFRPANMGFCVDWSDHMARHFGAPVKNCGLRVAGRMHRGEIVVSGRGLEGGGIYAISRALREGAGLALDLKPDLSCHEVAARLARPRGKASVATHLRKALGLTPVQIALLNEFARPFPDDLASVIKALPIPLGPPRPIDEAISTAGGVRRDALDDQLMLLDRPGTFACGEMLDWEAPTGGYLLTGCFATGLWAGRHAATYRLA